MLAVIRVRGLCKVNRNIERAMQQMNLTRVNSMALIQEKKESLGQIKKAQSYITFGKIDEKTLTDLLKKRGRLPGNKRLSEAYLKEKNIASFEDLSKNLLEGKEKLDNLGIKKVFRLTPPRKGYERQGIKKPFTIGGALGDRGEAINALILKMI